MTMPVECVSEDFSDPEAVSGSSTSILLVIFHLFYNLSAIDSKKGIVLTIPFF